MDWNIFLPIFIITLRNLFPIALLLGIIFASFQRIKKTEYYRQIYLGISGGIVASTLVAYLFSQGLNDLESSGHNSWIFTPLIINISTFITIGLLIWFILWLGQQGCIVKNLGSTNEILIGKYSRQLVFYLALFLIINKGIELILLINSQSENNIFASSLGMITSCIFLTIITTAFIYLQTRLTTDLFFQLSGFFLIFVSGGLMVNTLYNIEENMSFINELSTTQNWCLFSQDSCLLGSLLWQDNSWFLENKFPFIALKILFGYHDHVYLISLILYLLFITIISKLYLQNLKNFS